VQEQYMENIGNKKGKPCGSKYEDHQDASKEGKKKCKGKDKETIDATHQCKYPNNHYNHCDINVHIKDNFWKLHLDLNPKNHKMDSKIRRMWDLS